MAILEVRDISVSFGGIKPVRGVTFSVNDGSFTSIIGPNGAGKTSLFNLISGVNKIDSGEIFFQGRAIHGLHAHEIAKQGLVRTFQCEGDQTSHRCRESDDGSTRQSWRLSLEILHPSLTF
jgi:branched-chain amino acid transport system ATP-binding protein